MRARCETVYHPVSTCRMAPRVEGGVVDARLRVYGVDGLRVADASVFPWIVSGHTVRVLLSCCACCGALGVDACFGSFGLGWRMLCAGGEAGR